MIYFEARGEAVRGQIAVAQVVLNRAFSGLYPDTVCGVVYQNKHRHLACQFTFACDNNRGRGQGARHVGPRQKDRQSDARRPALAAGGGEIDPLPRLLGAPVLGQRDEEDVQIGVHTFYRPRAWGDGSEAPSWGTSAETAEISAKLAEAARSSAEQASAKRWIGAPNPLAPLHPGTIGPVCICLPICNAEIP